MNDLMIFNSPEFGQVRTLEEKGTVLFCAKDVALSLGYKDPTNAIKLHCRGVVKRHLPHPQSPNKKLEMNFIPEGDIYRLAASSELPGADRFESWIFDEVLPSIRKTGTYSTGSAKLADAEAKLNNSRARLAAEWRKIAGIVRVPEYQDLCASYASAALAGREVIPLPDCTEHLYTATEIGTLLGGIDKAKIGHIAKVNGLKTPEYGKTVWDKSPYSNKQVETFRYNGKALERFREILGVPAC